MKRHVLAILLGLLTVLLQIAPLTRSACCARRDPCCRPESAVGRVAAEAGALLTQARACCRPIAPVVARATVEPIISPDQEGLPATAGLSLDVPQPPIVLPAPPGARGRPGPPPSPRPSRAPPLA